MKDGKYTLLILVLIWLLFSSFDRKKQHTIIIKDHSNTIEMLGPISDTLTIVNPETGDEITRVTPMVYFPIRFNGNIVANTRKYNDTVYKFIRNQEEYFMKILDRATKVLTDITSLGRGEYFLNLSNVIVDKKGRIVYWEFKGITQNISYTDTSIISWTKHDTDSDHFPSSVVSTTSSGDTTAFRIMGQNKMDTSLVIAPNSTTLITTMHIKNKELEKIINSKIKAFLHSAPKMQICIDNNKPIFYGFNIESGVGIER